jgi:membrane protein
MPSLPGAGFARRLVTRIVEDEVPDLAAGIAYRLLFAVFPFAIFLAALSAFAAPALGLGDPTGTIIGGVSDNLPPAIAGELRPQLEAVLGTTQPGLLSIGAVTALWAAASGISSLINAMNKAYEVKETRSFLRRTAVSLGLTVIGSVGILIAFVTIVGGSLITQEVAARLGLGAGAWNAILLLRLPLVLLLVSIAVAVLFKLGPNVSVSFRWALIGGAVFAVGWLLATLLFGLYVANFGSYSNTYGALGGVVVLMLWFYLTGLLLLVAAEVTSQLASEREPHVIRARRREVAAAAPEAADSGRVAGAGWR